MSVLLQNMVGACFTAASSVQAVRTPGGYLLMRRRSLSKAKHNLGFTMKANWHSFSRSMIQRFAEEMKRVWT